MCAPRCPEAVALGLEVGIVDGDGKEKPIGMTRDVSDTANVQGGVYPRMTAVKLTSLEAEELGKIVAKLARDPLNKDDKHARPVNGLLLLVNPFDYWEKFMPATTPRATDGTFNHDVLPIPAKMIQTPALEKGVAVIGIAKKYFAALGSPRKGEYCLRRQRALYRGRARLHGKAVRRRLPDGRICIRASGRVRAETVCTDCKRYSRMKSL